MVPELLPRSAVRTLMVVAAAGERGTTIAGTARAVELSKSRTTRLLMELVELGYAIRRPNPEHLMQPLFTATNRGQRLAKAHIAVERAMAAA